MFSVWRLRPMWQGLGCGMVAIALITACESTNLPVTNNPSDQPPQVENTVTPSPSQPPATETSTDPMVYWLQSEGDRLVLVPEAVTPVKDTPTAQLTTLFEQLLNDKPTDGALSSTIPTGTKLLSLMIQQDGIVVNLSADFTTGGGSASMIGRVGQILYTATSMDPTAAVWLQIDGEPLTVLGGEGLEVPQPLTRAVFTANFEM